MAKYDRRPVSETSLRDLMSADAGEGRREQRDGQLMNYSEQISAVETWSIEESSNGKVGKEVNGDREIESLKLCIA